MALLKSIIESTMAPLPKGHDSEPLDWSTNQEDDSYQIAPNTAATYIYILNRLNSRVRRSNEKRLELQPECISVERTHDHLWAAPMELVSALMEIDDLANTTLLSYCNALKWHIRTAVPNWKGDPAWITLCNFVSQLKQKTIAIRREALALKNRKSKSDVEIQFPRENMRDRLKPKTIPITDWKFLEEELNARFFHSGPRKRMKKTPLAVLFWLQATIVCGARPVEWLSAKWADTKQTRLLIKTAKVKSGPPAFRRDTEDFDESYIPLEVEPWFNTDFGFYPSVGWREIPISSGRDQDIINTHLELFWKNVQCSNDVQEVERQVNQMKRYEKYRKLCQKYLQRLCVQVWGKDPRKSYTLYCARGQFSANMKSAFGVEKTAELMGHSRSDSPAAASYGVRRQAHPDFKSSRAGPKLTFRESPIQAVEDVNDDSINLDLDLALSNEFESSDELGISETNFEFDIQGSLPIPRG